MAFAATMLSTEPRSFSIGPWKVQYFTYTAASADVSGTVTATSLTTVIATIMDGQLTYTAAPTYSGNVTTLAFTDPAANRFGTGYCLGR